MVVAVVAPTLVQCHPKRAGFELTYLRTPPDKDFTETVAPNGTVLLDGKESGYVDDTIVKNEHHFTELRVTQDGKIFTGHDDQLGAFSGPDIITFTEHARRLHLDKDTIFIEDDTGYHSPMVRVSPAPADVHRRALLEAAFWAETAPVYRDQIINRPSK